MIANATQTVACEPSVNCMTITPSMAANWLEHANSKNRNLSDAHVKRLASDMRQDRWMLTHEGIAFDPHGVLLDGQHRLRAIIEADRPVQMHVWFNVTPEALMTIGTGRARSLVDVLHLAGGHGKITQQDVSVLRTMLGGLNGPKAMSSSEAAQALALHHDAVCFAINVLPNTKYIANAVTRAVMARAYYSADHRKLNEFGRMLTSGIVPNADATSVILLRQYLQTKTGGSRAERRDRYTKTQRALVAYLQGDSLAKLYAAAQEHFPLPEEIKA